MMVGQKWVSKIHSEEWVVITEVYLQNGVPWVKMICDGGHRWNWSQTIMNQLWRLDETSVVEQILKNYENR